MRKTKRFSIIILSFPILTFAAACTFGGATATATPTVAPAATVTSSPTPEPTVAADITGAIQLTGNPEITGLIIATPLPTESPESPIPTGSSSGRPGETEYPLPTERPVITEATE